MRQKEVLDKFFETNREQVQKILRTSELVCLFGLVISLVLPKLNLPDNYMTALTGVVTIMLSLLAFIYALLGISFQAVFKVEGKSIDLRLLKFAYLMLATTAMGILFALKDWPGGEIMLMGGTVILFIASIIILFRTTALKDENPSLRLHLKNFLIKAVPFLLIGIFFLKASTS